MTGDKDVPGAWTSAALRDGGLNGARAVLAMESAALAAMTPLAREWLRRREDSLAATRRLLDSLGTATDPGAIAQAQQLWWTGVTERLTQDVGAWTQFGMALLRLPDAAVPPEREAAPAPRARAPQAVAA
jgi:hypothetical protein